MKIAVYTIDTVSPRDANEEADFCDILNLPSLKYGSVQFIGRFSHWISKAQLRAMQLVDAKFYDRNIEAWREGKLIVSESKLFAQFAGQL